MWWLWIVQVFFYYYQLLQLHISSRSPINASFLGNVGFVGALFACDFWSLGEQVLPGAVKCVGCPVCSTDPPQCWGPMCAQLLGLLRLASAAKSRLCPAPGPSRAGQVLGRSCSSSVPQMGTATASIPYPLPSPGTQRRVWAGELEFVLRSCG